MIAVVIPTIPGREELHARTVAAYQATAEVITITVRNRPTIGQAWNDGAAAALDTGAEYLHLSADDVEPQPGWAEAAIGAINSANNETPWFYPSPRILNADGTLHSCGTMGGGMLLPECRTGTPCGASPFPFMRMRHWEQIGPALPIHYYADDYLAWRARTHGFEIAVVRDYCLLHHEGLVGRTRVVHRAMADRAAFLAAIGVESPASVEVLS